MTRGGPGVETDMAKRAGRVQVNRVAGQNELSNKLFVIFFKMFWDIDIV